MLTTTSWLSRVRTRARGSCKCVDPMFFASSKSPCRNEAETQRSTCALQASDTTQNAVGGFGSFEREIFRRHRARMRRTRSPRNFDERLTLAPRNAESRFDRSSKKPIHDTIITKPTNNLIGSSDRDDGSELRPFSAGARNSATSFQEMPRPRNEAAHATAVTAAPTAKPIPRSRKSNLFGNFAGVSSVTGNNLTPKRDSATFYDRLFDQRALLSRKSRMVAPSSNSGSKPVASTNA